MKLASTIPSRDRVRQSHVWRGWMSLGSFSAPENEHKYFIAQQIGRCVFSDLKSKVLISNVSNNSRRGATKAFTERGLYMLATVLKGERARQVTF